MDYLLRFGTVLLAMAALFGVWFLVRKGVGWLWPRADGVDSAMASVLIIMLLALAAGIAAVAGTGLADVSGRCGAGTVRVEERVWTGKGYRVESVCVVDVAR